MKWIVTIWYLLHPYLIFCQQALHNDELNASQLEELSEAEDVVSEDDYEYQQLTYFRKHPVNLNSRYSELTEFPLLDQLLLSNLFQYRKVLGDLVSIYELQSVPGFTIEVIKRILPYVTVHDDQLNFTQIKERFKGGDHSLLIRPFYTPEKANGFIRKDPVSTEIFNGSRLALLFRYKYQYRQLLQYGIVGDKDAGEQFFSTTQRFIPDFYSFHFFIRRWGWIKSLAVGDYTINLGQGLIHWQSQAFKKSSAVINIKRQSETLRPYHSAGEYNFLRGIAATVKKGNWEATIFQSIRKLSANVNYDVVQGLVISSIQTSGMHRTLSEVNDKNKVNLLVTGGNIKLMIQSCHLSLNGVRYYYSLPILKRDEPYNLFSLKGKHLQLYSFDYSYTFRNFHFFGESAISPDKSYALVNCMMTSIDASTDLAVVHRSIGRSYQSIYGNAFTENTLPTNENGIYLGLWCKPLHRWRVDVYADLYSFPWLKYRLDAPGSGLQYLIQLTWKPDKKVEVYSRYRNKMKPINTDPDSEMHIPELNVTTNWRTQVNFQINRNILLRKRIEICWFKQPIEGAGILSDAEQQNREVQTGYLIYTDVVFKPFGKRISGNFRIQVFETSGYDTRLYAFENDVLFSGKSPSFSDKGVRYYLNLSGKFTLKHLNHSQLTISLKLGSLVFDNKIIIGSGPSSYNGRRKSDVTFQIILNP